MRRFVPRVLVPVVFVALALLLGQRLLNLYTGPWASFLRPTGEFLLAAADHDSTRLARLGASEALIRKTLAAAELHPDQVGLDQLRLFNGERSGDTTRVTFSHSGCSGGILVVTFVGSSSPPRIQDANLPCDVR